MEKYLIWRRCAVECKLTHIHEFYAPRDTFVKTKTNSFRYITICSDRQAVMNVHGGLFGNLNLHSIAESNFQNANSYEANQHSERKGLVPIYSVWKWIMFVRLKYFGNILNCGCTCIQCGDVQLSHFVFDSFVCVIKPLHRLRYGYRRHQITKWVLVVFGFILLDSFAQVVSNEHFISWMNSSFHFRTFGFDGKWNHIHRLLEIQSESNSIYTGELHCMCDCGPWMHVVY